MKVLPEKIGVLKLVDLRGYEQEEEVAIPGVSRRTAWRDLREARRKVVDAFINANRIKLSGFILESQGNAPT